MKFTKIIAVVLAAVIAAFSYWLVVKPSGMEKHVLLLLEQESQIQVDGQGEVIQQKALIGRFYDIYGYRTVWNGNSNPTLQKGAALAAMLKLADSLALNQQDYHLEIVLKYDSLMASSVTTDEQKASLDVVFTDAAVSFLHDVAYGQQIRLSHQGVKVHIDSNLITEAANTVLKTGDYYKAIQMVQPRFKEYHRLLAYYNALRNCLRAIPAEARSHADEKQHSKIACYVGSLYSNAVIPVDSVLQSTYIKKLQQLFMLDTSEKPDARTLETIQTNERIHLTYLQDAINHWRWANRLNAPKLIMVNVAAAHLKVLAADSSENLFMRVIVGKPKTKTPAFTAYMTSVITYPYWSVPYSIATKEILPKVKRNIHYLDQQNMQVLDARGNVLNPANIQWHRYGTSNFPYFFRQSTGCDNSLGVLKFDLNSPYSIYLHDTNVRALFGRNERHLSHGCIRVQKPKELAHIVLEGKMDSTIIQKLDSCVRDQKPSAIKLPAQIPVLMFYLPVDIGEDGSIHFYKDIYKN